MLKSARVPSEQFLTTVCHMVQLLSPSMDLCTVGEMVQMSPQISTINKVPMQL